MADKDHKEKDLSPEELLKMLMKNFGAEQEEQGTQMTMEESVQKPKVYRARLEEKKPRDTISDEIEEEEDDGISEQLARSIANAERYVSGMNAPKPAKDDEEKSEEPEEPEEQPSQEIDGIALPAEEPSTQTEQPADEQPEKVEEPPEASPDETNAPEESAPEEPTEEIIEPEEPAEESGIPEEFFIPEQEARADKHEEELSEAEPDAEELPEEKPDVEELPEEPREERAEEVFFEERPEEREDAGTVSEKAAEQTPDEEDRYDFPIIGLVKDEPEEPEEADATKQEEEEVPAEEEPTEETPEPEEPEEKEIDDDEAHLMMIFGKDKELGKKIGKEGVEKLRREMDLDEPAKQTKKKEKPQEEKRDKREKEAYVSREQNEAFFKKFRRSYALTTARLIAALIFTLVIAVFEIGPAAAGSKEAFFTGVFAKLFANPVYTALLGLQVTILLTLLSLKECIAGVKAIRSGRSSPELFLLLAGIFTVVYECGLLYCHSVKAQLYNLPLALGVCFAILFTRIHLKNDLLSFKIISSKKSKYAIENLAEGESKLEKEAFEDCVSDLSGICGVKKAGFIKDYTARVSKEPRFLAVSGILAAVTVVVAVIFFLLGYYFSTEVTTKQKMLSAFTACILSVMFCTPLSAFISFSFPLLKASKKAFTLDSAIVGAASTEEYANATVISFEDKDVFPAKNVRVRSLKLFADSRIDHVLFGAASVFHKLGGPLDDVFAVATKDSGITTDVSILYVGSGGVEAAVRGVHVCIGSADFMRKKGLLSGRDEQDEALELEGRVSIMYVALGRELASKMYIEYKADKEFGALMSSLYKSGMCIGIRTLDPNIDDRMMRLHTDLGKYPMRILRMEKAEEEPVKEEMSSGVVSKKSTKNLLKTLTFCKRVLQVIRAETILKVLSIALGAALTGLLLAMSYNGRLAGVYSVGSYWMALYQSCWAALMALIALLFA